MANIAGYRAVLLAAVEGQLDQAGQVGDGLLQVPDHVFEVGILLGLAVHFQPDVGLGKMADLFDRVQVAAWRRLVETLAHIPGPALFAQCDLNIAAGHIQTDGISVDMVERGLFGNIAAALADRGDQLDLVVQIGSLRRIVDGRSGRYDPDTRPAGVAAGGLSLRLRQAGAHQLA